MSTLHITEKLSVTPLIGIQDAVFAKHYRDGLWWSLYGEYEGDKPFPDRYLVDNLKRDVAHGYFDDQHNDWLPYIGFYFGAVHGCILSPETCQLRPDITALATFTHPDAARGYNVGRRDCIYYMPSDTQICTDAGLIEELRQIALGGLLSTKEPRLYRVQCKMARLTDDGSCIIFNAFNTIPGEGGRRSGVKGYRGEVEYFGVYSPDTGKCYLVPVDAVPIGGARLRLTKSRNNQEKSVRWAKEFEI